MKRYLQSLSHVGNIVFSAHTTCSQTPYCQLYSQKMTASLFGFGLTHAPARLQGFVRKCSIKGKYRGKAATAYNERFGAMAGVPRWIALQNSKLSGSWQVCVARHCVVCKFWAKNIVNEKNINRTVSWDNVIFLCNDKCFYFL
jgi:hypothetical protein